MGRFPYAAFSFTFPSFFLPFQVETGSCSIGHGPYDYDIFSDLTRGFPRYFGLFDSKLKARGLRGRPVMSPYFW